MCFGDGRPGAVSRRTARVDRFLHMHINYMGEIDYAIEDVLFIIKIAQKILAEEPTLIEIKAPCAIIGDIHGQYEDLHRIFAVLSGESNGSSSRMPFVFLGDYVDRGKQSLECICCVLACKIKFPNKFILLRGNHESPEINDTYGFLDELRRRFQSRARKLWRAFNKLFAYLPLGALINKKILCIHGGFGPSFGSLDDIRNTRRPINKVCEHALATDLLWSDPMIQLHGFIKNSLRQMSVFYGENVVLEMCEKMKVDLVVRGHQLMANGFGFFCGRKLVTLFSAPRHIPSLNNRGAIMTVTRSLKVGIILLCHVTPASQGRSRFEEFYDRHNDGSSYVWRSAVVNGMLFDSGGEDSVTCFSPTDHSRPQKAKPKSLKSPGKSNKISRPEQFSAC